MKVAVTETRETAGARPERAQAADPAAFKAALDLNLRKGEKVEPVEGHAYAEIVSGRREGMYVNTSGNARHGEAFVLVERGGVDYHVYGGGRDRRVIAVKPDAPKAAAPEDSKGAAPDAPNGAEPDAPKAVEPDAPKAVEPRRGEKLEPVDGHAYSEIVSGRREGMYLNTSGNERHGDAFVLVRRRGIEYHIYGSGSDRLVVALKPAADED